MCLKCCLQCSPAGCTIIQFRSGGTIVQFRSGGCLDHFQNGTSQVPEHNTPMFLCTSEGSLCHDGAWHSSAGSALKYWPHRLFYGFQQAGKAAFVQPGTSQVPEHNIPMFLYTSEGSLCHDGAWHSSAGSALKYWPHRLFYGFQQAGKAAFVQPAGSCQSLHAWLPRSLSGH